MTARTKALLSAIVIGVVVGAAYPFVDVAMSCRVPESEACVYTLGMAKHTLGKGMTSTWQKYDVAVVSELKAACERAAPGRR